MNARTCNGKEVESVKSCPPSIQSPSPQSSPSEGRGVFLEKYHVHLKGRGSKKFLLPWREKVGMRGGEASFVGEINFFAEKFCSPG